MAIDTAELTGEQLRAQTTDWLREHLPAGWMDAVDAGDRDDVDPAARRARLRRLVQGARRGGLRDADVARRVRRRALALARAGQARQRGAQPLQGRRGRSTSSASGWVARPLIQWGTEEQKHRMLRPLATNEEIWCQLFSEPGAGSDVAGLSTRAVRDGDEWVVNGQKVWTTLAHMSRCGMLIARTNPDVPKHARSHVLRGRHAGEPASRSGRSSRSPATPSSTRCSWRRCGSPTRCASGPRATAGEWRSRP